MRNRIKKVLIFSLAYYPSYVGGAEVAMREITGRISPEEYEFHMITLRFDSRLPKEEKIGNVHVHRFGFTKKGTSIRDLSRFPLFLNKYLFPVLGYRKACALHDKYHFDIMWNMMANYAAFAGLFFKLSRPKVKYLLTLQEGDPIAYIRGRVRFVYPLFRKIFTKADLVQTISTYLARWARKEGYLGPLFVVPNGVDTGRFGQEVPEEELARARKKLGKKEGNVYLVTSSRLVKKNACDDVIKALVYLPERVSFVVMGSGPEEAALRKLAELNSVSSRVLFLGQVDHTEMPKYLKSCDIFVRPSLSEGMGNSFVEAMAAGLPVIATQEGGIADFLFDPERNPEKSPTGRAVNPRDPKGIARAVKLFLEDKETTARIVENARKMVFEKYDWDIIARTMREKVFDPLLKK